MSLDDPEQRSRRARAAILGRIRAAQGRAGSVESSEGLPLAEREAVATYLRARPRGPASRIGGDLVEHFCRQAAVMQSTTDRVGEWIEVPGAVARYLSRQSLEARGCVWPSLPKLDWQSAGVHVEARAAVDADLIGITSAFAGIAETGTLMTLSGPDTPGSASLLPETHVAIVEARRVMASMEDAWALLRSEHGRPPRVVNFISEIGRAHV